MDTGIIKKTHLNKVIEGLLQSGEVVAPTLQNDITMFSAVKSADEIDLDYTNTKLSPKGCLFPQAEVLFYYEKRDHKITPPPDNSKGPAILLGVRPCDARAMAMLDPVFDDPQYKDVPYINRRKNMIVIGLACTDPQSTCFCPSTGGNPLDTTGMDMIWEDLGDRYLVKSITDRGKKIFSRMQGIEKAGPKDIKESEEQAQKIVSQIQPAFELEEVTERLQSSFNDPIWQSIHERCLGCATCTYVCPTCHCFDIQDENHHDKGRRIRLWDSCMFPLFTLHASGHNPRASGKERMRQRIMHKFNYFNAKNGQSACVGCGRCIKECPVNLDIREILSLCCT